MTPEVPEDCMNLIEPLVSLQGTEEETFLSSCYLNNNLSNVCIPSQITPAVLPGGQVEVAEK